MQLLHIDKYHQLICQGITVIYWVFSGPCSKGEEETTVGAGKNKHTLTQKSGINRVIMRIQSHG